MTRQRFSTFLLILSLFSITAHAQTEESKGSGKLFTAPFKHSLPNAIGKDNYVYIPIHKIHKKKVSFVDQDLLLRWKLVNPGDLSSLKEAFANRFGFEVVRPGEKGLEVVPGVKVFAAAYDDGYLGRGDGRSAWLFETFVPGVGMVDFGAKGTGLTVYGIPQESIDKGYHIGEKDGYLSLHEAYITLVNSWILNSLGIQSEKILGIIETGKKTGYNLEPVDIQPTAIVIRAFNNGLRGANFEKYSTQEMISVTKWLRAREAKRLGLSLDSVSTVDYLRSKIKRDARRSARAQHFWVVHGAINPSNVYEGGWADLIFVEAMRVPDGRYTPLSVPSRLEYQMHRFFSTTEQFYKKIAAAHPEASEVNLKQEYWSAYQNELTRLELISAGFKPMTAETIVVRYPKLATKYRDAIWEANYLSLRTDTRRLKRELAHALRDRGSISDAEYTKNLRILHAAARIGNHKPARVQTEYMRPMDRWKYRLSQLVKTLTGRNPNRDSELSVRKLKKIAKLTEQLARAAENVELKSAAEIATDMTKRTASLAKLRLPTPKEIQHGYEQYLKNGQGNLNNHPDLAVLKSMTAKAEKLTSAIYETPPASKTNKPRMTLAQYRTAPKLRSQENPRIKDKTIEKISEKITTKNYRRLLALLTGAAPMPKALGGKKITDRYTAKNLAIVRQFLVRELHRMGFENISYEKFGGLRAADGMNLYVEIPGKGEGIMLVGAHYDTTGPGKPGANDNGSGVTSLLSIAKALKESGVTPERTIRFVFFDHEEFRLLGSDAHIKRALARNEKIDLFLNLDMVGRSEVTGKWAAFDPGDYAELSKFILGVNKERGLNFELDVWKGFEGDNLVGKARGIPTVSFFDDARMKDGTKKISDPNNHKKTDTMDKVNVEYAVLIARLVAAIAHEASLSKAEWTIPKSKGLQQYAADVARSVGDGISETGKISGKLCP